MLSSVWVSTFVLPLKPIRLICFCSVTVNVTTTPPVVVGSALASTLANFLSV